MLILVGQTALCWLVISLIGLAALPLAFWLLERLPGKGFAFARPLGLLLVSYLLWLGASLRIFQNDIGGLIAALLGLVGISAWLAFRKGGNWAALCAHLRQNPAWVLASEVLFALALLGWAFLRATTTARAMPTGGEKFMEMAFLNGVLNSPYFPPIDPWLSGFSISYYYFGYIMMAVLTRLTQFPSTVAFDLYDALLFALSIQLSFGLVSEMAALSGARRAGRLAAGAAAAFFTSGAGNLEGLLEALHSRGWLSPAFTAWLGLPGFPPSGPINHTFYPGNADWWWWRASRVLSDLGFDGKPLPLNPITEFPFFSFLLGDNHPHVLALPFGLLAAAVGLDWAAAGGRIPRLRLAFSALVIGSLIFLNTWDFPVLFGLALLAYLAGEYSRAGRLSPSAWREVLWRAAGLGVGGILFYLPFLLSFHSQAGGVLPYVFPPTRLVQYLVMFGLFVAVLLFFLPASLRHQNAASAQPFGLKRLGAWWLRAMLGFGLLFTACILLAVMVLVVDQLRGGGLAQSVQSWMGGGGLDQALLRAFTSRLANPWLFLLLTLLLTLAAAGLRASPRLDPASGPDSGLTFARLLALCGLGLTFAVEFFYLRDSFGVRLNTVFKFYFQGWTLLSCASGYAVWWMADRASRLRVPFFCIISLLSAVSLVYPLMAAASRTSGYDQPPLLDAAAQLRRDNPDDWAAIDWLGAQARGGLPPTILEAPCPSYCFGGRISAFSGYPTLLGWSDHEGQWRGSFSEQAKREPDIRAIYTNASILDTRALLNKWQVRYVILGETERAYIRTQCVQDNSACTPETVQAKLEQSLLIAFRQGSLTVFQNSLP